LALFCWQFPQLLITDLENATALLRGLRTPCPAFGSLAMVGDDSTVHVVDSTRHIFNP